jgi:hypothetical protein
MSLSTLRTDSEKNQKMIQRQACRLLGVANTVFTDPAIQALKAELLHVRAERDSLRLSLKTCTRDMISVAAVVDAIMLFNNSDSGLLCCCKHCGKVFQMQPEKIRRKAGCTVFNSLIELLRENNLTFSFLKYYKGTPCEGLPPVPAGFPPTGTAFLPSTLSHLDSHFVFEQMGNAYNFSFGRPLWYVDSPYHPEGMKVLGLIKTLHRKAIDG